MNNLNDVYKILADKQIQKLINNRNYTELYKLLYEHFYSTTKLEVVGQVTQMLYDIDEDPLKYMQTIPTYYLFGTNIHKFDIPDNIYAIDYAAFSKSSLRSIAIPNTIENLDISIFSYCEELKKVHIGSGIESISENCFFSCINLEDITFSEGLKTIESLAFALCESLKTIVLPLSLRDIDSYAFEGCTGLSDVYIRNNIERISNDAFSKCQYLTIHFEGTKIQFMRALIDGDLKYINTCKVICKDGTIDF